MAEGFSLERVLPGERARLVRLCARLSGDADAAEDLAQETLVEAWRQRARLSDPSGVSPWLSAIARNICLRWGRRSGRELARSAPRAPSGDELSGIEALPDDFDIELALERDELADLLDRALALLPADTREALVARYVEETPLAEAAARLGLSENALAVRVHRGKLALRRLLSTDLRDEAASFGLAQPASEQQTRIWCPLCGQARLRGRLDPASGELVLHCDECCTEPDITLSQAHFPELLGGVTSIRVAISRLLIWGERFYLSGLGRGEVTCFECGRTARAEYIPRFTKPILRHQSHGLSFVCPSCGEISWTLAGSVGLFMPDGRRFWKEHPRIEMLPAREVTADNVPALLFGFRSVTDDARIDLLIGRERAGLIGVHVTRSPHG